MAKILYYFSDTSANHERRIKNLPGGVGYYRICKVAEQAKNHQVTVCGSDFTKKGETMAERWERIFTEYDIFWASYFSDPNEASAMYETRNRLGKKVVLDLDDNYFDILDSHPLYDKLKAGKRDKAFISTILSFADVITVSTEPLRQRVIKHMKEVYGLNKVVIVLPNMNDLKDWDFVPKPLNKNKFIIGYMGSNSHQEDMKMVVPEILKIMKKYKNVYFNSVGSISKEDLYLFDKFGSDEMNRCNLLPPTWTFKDYPEMISKQKWNIGIAPLADNAFTRCKSHIKFMEYSSLKIPVIASRVYPYYVPIKDREVGTHEDTCLLVEPNEWYDAIESLILNKEAGLKMADNAYNHIKTNWQYDDGLITNIIDEVVRCTEITE